MIDNRVNTFLHVCKTMNYTKAAEDLKMTQPSVSQHIHYLEQFYNVKLFTYQNRKLELTEQGAFLKKHFETLNHDIKYMRDTVQNIKKKRKLKIGATLSIGEFYIPDMLSKFIQANPDIELTITIADTQELLNRLDSGNVDFILCEGYFDKNQYAYELIKEEKMCIICASDYDYSNISNLESLFNHHLLLREVGSGTRKIFENHLNEHNYSLKNFIRVSEITSPHLIKKLLIDKIGLSVLYKTVVKTELDNNVLIEIEVPEINIIHEFNAVWKQNSIFGNQYKEIINQLIRMN